MAQCSQCRREISTWEAAKNLVHKKSLSGLSEDATVISEDFETWCHDCTCEIFERDPDTEEPLS